jgi:PII-like signaling protein
MNDMETIPHGRLLRIFICESDQYDGRPADAAIIDALQSAGVSGATVLRGVAGFGTSSVMHTTHVLRLSENLPMVIEVVDTAGKIDSVLPAIEKMIGDGLITMQEITIRRRKTSR